MRELLIVVASFVTGSLAMQPPAYKNQFQELQHLQLQTQQGAHLFSDLPPKIQSEVLKTPFLNDLSNVINKANELRLQPGIQAIELIAKTVRPFFETELFKDPNLQQAIVNFLIENQGMHNILTDEVYHLIWVGRAPDFQLVAKIIVASVIGAVAWLSNAMKGDKTQFIANLASNNVPYFLSTYNPDKLSDYEDTMANAMYNLLESGVWIYRLIGDSGDFAQKYETASVEERKRLLKGRAELQRGIFFNENPHLRK